ncbi:flavin reductase family protein [Streptomyces sp. NPDC051219]|uniref:flavin reductase family protein n=1 Tax=Streptomyces sp. NPDC051219 TaxID=3155283 RepID=UPI00344A3DFB
MTRAAIQEPSAKSGETAAALTDTIRRVVTGVTVVTCGNAADVEGVTVSTLTTIPGDPPMVCVALRRNSRGLKALVAASTFVANSLAADHEPLARHFARRYRAKGLDQLPSDAWAGCSPSGVPQLRDAVSWLECRLVQTVTVGDHELVVARVLSATSGTADPLVNFAGALHAGPSCVQHTERKHQ